MRRLLDRITAVYAPECCVVCDKEGSALCDWCRPDAVQLLPSTCFRCNSLTNDFRVCKKCSHHSPLVHVWVVSQYGGVVKQLVRGLKYDRKFYYAPVIAELMMEQLPYFENHELILSWLPTATSRKRRRGFDHAELIASHLGRLLGTGTSSTLSRLDQERQVGKNRAQRLKSPFNFVVDADVKNKKVLLIDDVITTGATLASAAKALKKAGAKQVSAIVAASNLRSSAESDKLI